MIAIVAERSGATGTQMADGEVGAINNVTSPAYKAVDLDTFALLRGGQSINVPRR